MRGQAGAVIRERPTGVIQFADPGFEPPFPGARQTARRTVMRHRRRRGTSDIASHGAGCELPGGQERARHTFVTTMLAAGVDLRDMQIGARHADPRTTMRYDRARKNLDRHPNYILAAYMASGT